MGSMISIKVMMICCSTLLLIMALAMKIVSVSFSFSQFPSCWNTFISWMRPPYLYLIVNGIIFGIVASSRFQRDQADEPVQLVDADDHTDHFVHRTEMIEYSPKYRVSDQRRVYERRDEKNMVEEVIKPMVFSGFPVTEPDLEVPEAEYEDNTDDEVIISNSTWMLPEKIIEPSDKILLPAENSLVSSRFSHRKTVKTSHSEGVGRATMVSKPRRPETLEDTWKMITEGRSVALSRQMKEYDTWVNEGRDMYIGYDYEMEASPIMKTFKERTNYQKLAPVKITEKLIRKDPSLSRGELNRRVEAFINNFKENMKLQKQQSKKQYIETIDQKRKPRSN